MFQTVVQQLNAEGQLIYISQTSPKIGELNMNPSSSYSLPHQVFVTGFLSHQEEFVAGENVGSTWYGGTGWLRLRQIPEGADCNRLACTITRPRWATRELA